MEIRSSTNVPPAGTAGVRTPRRAAADPDDGTASFASSRALQDALIAEPEVRTGQVDRLRQVLSDSGGEYPPAAIVKKVSVLLADRIYPREDEQPA